MRRLAQHRARYRWYSPGGGVGNRWSCVKKRAVVARFNRRHHRWPVVVIVTSTSPITADPDQRGLQVTRTPLNLIGLPLTSVV